MNGDTWPGIDLGPVRVLYRADPIVLDVASVGTEIDDASVSDVELLDFDGDGRRDLAVAWFTTDLSSPATRQRFLTIFTNNGTGSFARAIDFDLYVPNAIDSYSAFRNGTAEIAVGDFDGDHDPDLAVTSYWGSEIWFIENLGGGAYQGHLANMFGQPDVVLGTPPAAAAADFDGDGRDDLVYIVDPILRTEGLTIHFWRTGGSIANMQRIDWEGIAGGQQVDWTRSLAVGDFNSDDRPDLAFTGSVNPPFEDDPVVVIWHSLNTNTQRFTVQQIIPSFLCSDVLAVRTFANEPHDLILGELGNGSRLERWKNNRDAPLSFVNDLEIDGLAGLSPDRGVILAQEDVNGDGPGDIVCKQRSGLDSDDNQIDLVLGGGVTADFVIAPHNAIDTTGLVDDAADPNLRSRNLAVGDLFGNRLPEIVAAFTPVIRPGGPRGDLQIVVWANSCLGDVDRDGRTDLSDLALVLLSLGGSPNPIDVDLNRDGVVDATDLGAVLADFGCDIAGD